MTLYNDISHCHAATCPLASDCYRHEAAREARRRGVERAFYAINPAYNSKTGQCPFIMPIR